MHGMDVSDYSEASDSSRIPLILSLLAFRSVWDSGLISFAKPAYI